MNYPDYVNSMQTAYSNMYAGMTSTLQPIMAMMQGQSPSAETHRRGHHHGCGCGCHEHERDCHHHCEYCIRCADAVETPAAAKSGRFQ